MKKVKSSKVEIGVRVKHIALMLINGSSKDDIVHYSSENWSVGIRQAAKYITKASLLIAKSVERDVNYDYSKAVLRFENLYKKALEKEDIRNAASINKDLSTLQGLYKTNVEHSGQVTFVSNIPD